MIVISVGTVVRASVPSSINGVVMLDRGTSAAGAVTTEFTDAIGNAGFGLLRDRTTGHGNLRKSHPMDSQYHTYFFPAFTTIASGNLWQPTYVRSSGGAITEIITLGAVLTMDSMIKPKIPELVWWEFIDWESGYSAGEGTDPWQSYKNTDPALVDIDGVTPITVGSPTWNAMTSADFKDNENIRHVKKLLDAGLILIINFGGEDWRGWEIKPWLAFPDQDDPGQVLKFTWIYSHLAARLAPLKTWIDAHYPGTPIGTGFLESVEGGDNPPCKNTVVIRDVAHLRLCLDYCNDLITALTSSMHYRGGWERLRRENKLVLAFCITTMDEFETPIGQGTLKECKDWITWITSQPPYNSPKDLWPMAQSVGDVEPNEDGTPGTPLTDFEKGLAVTQFQFEIAEAGYTYAASFPGISYSYGLVDGLPTAGFDPTAGIMGRVEGAFTIQPMYYPMALIGQCLVKGSDLIQTDCDDEFMIVYTLSWTDGDQEILSVFILNKDVARDVPLLVTGDWGSARCRLAKRYSETELTAPEILAPVTQVGALMVVSSAAKSLTYLELVEAGVSQLTEILDVRLSVAIDQPFPIGRQWRKPSEIWAAAVGRQLVTPIISVGSENANVRTINIQLKNEYGVNIDYVESFELVVFSDQSMTALSNGGSTGVAIGTDGLLQPLVAKKIFFCTTEANGHWDGTWTDSGTDPACIGLHLPGGAWALSAEFANT